MSIDKQKLLAWFAELEENEWHISTNDVLAVMSMEIEKGRFDSPSNQGEAARLREALKWYADKDNYDWYEVGDVPVMQDEGRLAREAISSHTEDTGESHD